MDAKDMPPFPVPPLTLAVSECLTGAPVRYDGRHKREAMPHAALDDLYEFLPICPEVGIGLGVPRDPIRLEGDPGSPRARIVGEEATISRPRADVTEALRAFADRQLRVLDDVDGYVFMQDSPSCGLSGVSVFGSDAPDTGRGVYAARVSDRRPVLPVIEGAALFDPTGCASFVMRTFVYAHWRRTSVAGMTAARLVGFHTAYKYLVMAHDVQAYQRLGHLVSDLSGNLDDVAGRYVRALLEAVSRPASRAGHANAMAHLQGYVSRGVGATGELASLIESYRRGGVPLSEPMSLLRRHLLKSGATYALNQAYLRSDLWSVISRAYNSVLGVGPHLRP
ncbi:MAG: DUF523 and DUF1722 domain-containing protein [Gammaproteobacteria bacterium]|nr:DUF523 and DUF1722 domain-containing protein [Gammaproteobacteria bacterium]